MLNYQGFCAATTSEAPVRLMISWKRNSIVNSLKFPFQLIISRTWASLVVAAHRILQDRKINKFNNYLSTSHNLEKVQLPFYNHPVSQQHCVGKTAHLSPHMPISVNATWLPFLEALSIIIKVYLYIEMSDMATFYPHCTGCHFVKNE